jgi:alpha-1,6-mannosyltransferase
MQVRFLFPVLPLFNMAAAAAVVRLHRNRRKGPVWAGLWLVAGALLAGSAAAAVLMAAVSRLNYPGGHALARLHALEAPSAALAVSTGNSQESGGNDAWVDE